VIATCSLDPECRTAHPFVVLATNSQRTAGPPPSPRRSERPLGRQGCPRGAATNSLFRQLPMCPWSNPIEIGDHPRRLGDGSEATARITRLELAPVWQGSAAPNPESRPELFQAERVVADQVALPGHVSGVRWPHIAREEQRAETSLTQDPGYSAPLRTRVGAAKSACPRPTTSKSASPGQVPRTKLACRRFIPRAQQTAHLGEFAIPLPQPDCAIRPGGNDCRPIRWRAGQAQRRNAGQGTCIDAGFWPGLGREPRTNSKSLRLETSSRTRVAHTAPCSTPQLCVRRGNSVS